MNHVINKNVLWAVFKRNFVSYFSSPTGYLFICVFVWLSVMAAFWPDEFFNANLANLAQLNKVFPWIMLVFIPAITMSIWAEERRQATDELLLTIPATDWDIVIGKYLAAVAIYTVSLAFSLLCTYTVLQMLGDPDVGLFLGTYFGYWLVGLAMLAVGMVASFLTANVTVAYILGALFNGILVVVATAPVMTAVVRTFLSIPAKLLGWVNAVLGLVKLAPERWEAAQHTLEETALNLPQQIAFHLQRWGIGGQFADFGRGVISLAGIIYFLSIVVIMLYLSMVLIGRRHWRLGPMLGSAAVFYGLLHLATIVLFVILGLGLSHWLAPMTVTVAVLAGSLLVHMGLLYLWPAVGFQTANLPGHYIVRTLSVATAAVGLTLFVHYHDLRLDVTEEGLNSLSRQTVQLVRNLEVGRPIVIEAFISPESDVPESYVQTRLNLLNHLYELAALGGDRIRLIVNTTERFSEEAARAEQRYKIQSKEVHSIDRGVLRTDNIFLGVAFTCGLEKVVVPFIDRGIPIEYELVRSLATVAGQKRKKIGVLETDAGLYGNFMVGIPQWPIIDELEKQYEVKRVDLNSALTEDFDALVAVQPSTLTPEQMEYFVQAVRSGTPTAIFEDPCPLFAPWVPATSEPRRPPSSPFMMMPRDLPKGDISRIWNLLGIDFPADRIVWQDYNPYQKIDLFREQKQFVFIGKGSGAEQPFNEDSIITSGLQNALFPFPGAIFKWRTSELNFLPLIQTGPHTGTVRYRDMFLFNPLTGRRQFRPNLQLVRTGESYILAARIRGKPKAEEPPEPSRPDLLMPPGSASYWPGSWLLASALPTHLSENPQTTEASGAPPSENAKPSSANQSASADSTEKASAPAEKTLPDSKGASDERGRSEKSPAPDEKVSPQDTAPIEKPVAKESAPSPPAQPKPAEVNVAVVADIDMLTPTFFALREQGDIEELGIAFDFDNVTFVLNLLDDLAGDTRFIEIRKRRPKHRTLTRIEEATRQAREETAKAREEAYKEAEKVREAEQAELDKRVEELRKRTDIPELEKAVQMLLLERDGQRRLDAKVKEAEAKRDAKIKQIETKLTRTIRQVQDSYKMWAVVLPPIPPLIVAIIVFLTRRAREREGVAKSRLRA